MFRCLNGLQKDWGLRKRRLEGSGLGGCMWCLSNDAFVVLIVSFIHPILRLLPIGWLRKSLKVRGLRFCNFSRCDEAFSSGSSPSSAISSSHARPLLIVLLPLLLLLHRRRRDCSSRLLSSVRCMATLFHEFAHAHDVLRRLPLLHHSELTSRGLPRDLHSHPNPNRRESGPENLEIDCPSYSNSHVRDSSGSKQVPADHHLLRRT